MKTYLLRRLAVCASVAAAATLSSCVDAPSAPEGQGLIAPNWVIAPAFALVGPAGPAMSPAQANALGSAFDLVDHFRLQAWRVPSGEQVVDVVVEVTPGQDEYPLSANVDVSKPDESFIVTITALQGDVELFKAENVPVVATPVGGGGGSPPTPPTIDLTFTGPGAQARSVQVAPAVTVLAPGGSTALASKTLDAGGAVIANAPLSWESSNPAVVTVVGGTVTGGSDGVATVTATSPTGLTATSDVYVVGGELAYVEGGVVKVRPAAGGTAASRSSGGGASGPAWSPDGSRLFYAQGGSVREADAGAALFAGAWPTVAPDGKTLAVERSGTIWFANDDGSNPTAGPSGTTPVWSASRTLTVGGGSIQTVGVDGSGRSTVVAGEATFPAVGGGGIAFVRGSSLMTTGGPLTNGVSGRPSWSVNGRWLAVRGGGGLMVVPADGSAPPVLLPGLAGASDPAWKPSGSLVPPAGVSLTGFDPDPPIPGQAVRLIGSGFDDVIPTNNKVFWPTTSGTEETTISEVTPSGVRTTMPLTVVAGQVRVERRGAQATLGFEPTFGSVEVTARLPWGAPLPGVGLQLKNRDGVVVANGVTNSAGAFVVGDLILGPYQLLVSAPTGYALGGGFDGSVSITGSSPVIVDLSFVPEVRSARLSPASPRLTVGDEMTVFVQPLDVNGQPIPSVEEGTWRSTSARMTINPSGLSAFLHAVSPSAVAGDATFTVALAGRTFSYGATITSSISGLVTKGEANEPVNGVEVTLKRDGVTVATTSTNSTGRYAFLNLLAGNYTVTPSAPPGSSASPASAAVNLNDATPTGTANFSLHAAVVGGDERRPGDVAIYKDYNAWFGSNKDEVFLQAAPFNFSPGSDYVVRPTAGLKEGIPSETSIIILTSLSDGSGPLSNVNDPAAQANLEAWVAGGGWLIVHAGDNIGGGYMVPGLTGIADDDGTCYGETLELSDHAFIRGPDGVLGTSDDLTDDNIDNGGRFCSDNHGSLAGILPEGAQVLMTEQGGDHRPTYATYEYGAGRVVVLTLSIEFSQHSPQTLINHFWWTIMGPDAPAPPALAPRIAPLKAMNRAVGAALPSTEVPPPGR